MLGSTEATIVRAFLMSSAADAGTDKEHFGHLTEPVVPSATMFWEEVTQEKTKWNARLTKS